MSADIESIRRLLALYADAVCRVDADQWGATWTEDAVWDMGAMSLEGRDDMVAQWSSILAGFDGVIHGYGDGWADLDTEAGTGTGRWYVTEYLKPAGAPARAMLGWYDDEYRMVDGEWKFSKRTLRPLYSGAPDMTGDFLGG